MKTHRFECAAVAVVSLCMISARSTSAQNQATSLSQKKVVTNHITGPFDVKLIRARHRNFHGRSSSFVLQHSGTMTRGTPQLIITVVPGSGAGQLAGNAGKMTINIAADGKHSYDFEYTLPNAN